MTDTYRQCELDAPTPREQPTPNDADFQAGLGAVAGLVADAFDLDDLLVEVANAAVRAIPGADGAGVTLLRMGHRDEVIEATASSALFVAAIDEIQYSIVHEGPCITATLDRRTVRSGSLGGEQKWPRFGPRVGRLGVHSALSVPLLLPDVVVGSINIYACRKNAFDDRAAELGELFARPAAVAVHNAQILARANALTARLQKALLTRPVIDQAIGLIRGRSGRTSEEALAHLRSISQAEQRKLADVAQHIVDEAARSARARRCI